MSNNLSFADALRGSVGKPDRSFLKGWRYRDCGSWDVYAVVIGESNGSDKDSFQQRVQVSSNLGVKDKASCGQGGI